MKQFLRQLLRRFTGSRPVDKLPNVVQLDEQLTRFIFSSVHFAAQTGRVKQAAFLPGKDGETSVYRITKLSNEVIWAIGNSIRAEPSKARADMVSSAPRQIGLRVEAAPEHHPRHAIIIGWPAEKDKQKMLAIELSKRATLHIAEKVA